MILNDHWVVTDRWSLIYNLQVKCIFRIQNFVDFKGYAHSLYKISSRMWGSILKQIDISVGKYFCLNFYIEVLASHHYPSINSSQLLPPSYKNTHFSELLNFRIVNKGLEFWKIKGDSAFSYCELYYSLIFIIWVFSRFYKHGPRIRFIIFVTITHSPPQVPLPGDITPGIFWE